MLRDSEEFVFTINKTFSGPDVGGPAARNVEAAASMSASASQAACSAEIYHFADGIIEIHSFASKGLPSHCFAFRAMDLDQLHTFLEIVRLKSFSKAAQTCYRTQPAISAQVRQLEQELN